MPTSPFVERIDGRRLQMQHACYFRPGRRADRCRGL
jgi:hypothetical protein